MINSCYKISLDIQDHSSNVLLRAKKGDTGRTLFITLTDGRNPYAISEECRAVFTAKKADGKTLFNECHIIGHVIVYEFTPQTTSVAGKAACEIKLYGADEKLLTSAHFTLIVDDTVYNEGDEVESSQEVTALTALVSETIELIEDVEEKVNSGAFMGAPGDTPYIGENGNWWVGETDTGVSAGGSANAIRFDGPQDLTPEEQAQAKRNMGITDAPVSSVNGKTGAVDLNASDVKARPDNWMPTAQEVGALPSTYTPPNQTAEQVGADPKGTAAATVSQHNAEADSHNDIRLELKAINDRLTAFFDSDDKTLDELSEIVAYITSNKTLIEAITTSKVSVADIINNLTTNVANKPLSAAQGVALKTLIDAITVPTKVSQLQNDAGYLTQHQDISGKLDAAKLPEAINTALAQAKATGDFDGRGIVSIVRTSGTGAAGTTDTYTVTYTDNTTSTIAVYNGKNGTNGTSVTVSSVTESTEDGGISTVKFSDGKTINIKNGKTGAPGKTPEMGTDYWTPADQEAMIQDVISALGGSPIFGVVDANNNIVLSGNLTEGVYTLKYEDADGTVYEIGTLNHSNEPEVTYTNLFDPNTATLNTRMSGSSSAPKANDGYVMTALIPIPETAVTKTSNAAFIAVPASMWSGSANMFLAKKDGTATQGYSSYSTTKGEVVGAWVKIPLLTEWGEDFTCNGVTISLYVKGSAITAADIQNIEIYFNEIPE